MNLRPAFAGLSNTTSSRQCSEEVFLCPEPNESTGLRSFLI